MQPLLQPPRPTRPAARNRIQESFLLKPRDARAPRPRTRARELFVSSDLGKQPLEAPAGEVSASGKCDERGSSAPENEVAGRKAAAPPYIYTSGSAFSRPRIRTQELKARLFCSLPSAPPSDPLLNTASPDLLEGVPGSEARRLNGNRLEVARESSS